MFVSTFWGFFLHHHKNFETADSLIPSGPGGSWGALPSYRCSLAKDAIVGCNVWLLRSPRVAWSLAAITSWHIWDSQIIQCELRRFWQPYHISNISKSEWMTYYISPHVIFEKVLQILSKNSAYEVKSCPIAGTYIIVNWCKLIVCIMYDHIVLWSSLKGSFSVSSPYFSVKKTSPKKWKKKKTKSQSLLGGNSHSWVKSAVEIDVKKKQQLFICLD